MINENKLAQSVAKKEGGEVNLPIAQIKEVQRHTLDALAVCKPSEVLALLEKHKERLDREAREEVIPCVPMPSPEDSPPCSA